LSKVFTLDVDNSGNPVNVDLSYLANRTTKMTGNQIAAEMTNYLNRAFGDEAYFDMSSASSREFTVRTSRVSTTTNGLTTPTPVPMALQAADFGLTSATIDWTQLTTEQVANAMQKRIDNTVALRTIVTAPVITTLGSPGTNGTTYSPAADANGHFPAGNITATTISGTTQTVTVYGSTTPVEVQYDYNARTFNFTDGTSTVSIAQGASGRNEVLGLDANPVVMNEDGSNSLQVLPNGDMIRPLAEQRYGIQVSYDAGTKTFAVKSGTTGDDSGIKLDLVKDSSGLSLGDKLFGFKNSEVLTSDVALRGIASQPAIAYGVTPTTNVTNNFAVDSTNNRFVVTVDGVKGTVVIPTDSAYSVESFANALEKGINSLANNTDGVPQSVNGVKVSYDYASSRFVFTSGTTSTDSYIKISGSSNWGLEQVEAGRGQTASWIKPTQHKDIVGGQLVPKYIDGSGLETTNGDGFSRLPAWSPIYLDKGELTFDTGGKLVSPQGGTQLETVYLAGGKGALTINIDYSASTQQTSPFAVLSQSQDGAPEGDLVGVTIGNDGLVSASYSNGTQKSLAKILLTNFSSPTGLRQIGDSSFLASAASGNPILGTAGTAGFGTIRAGATERSNVDLTQELVELITAQRNFQANAKAIETSTTMTQAIINIRG
jgi:flagellar hook-basal body protein